jgi:hypothetical protein
MKADFGQAFTISEFGRENFEVEMLRWTDEVMCRRLCCCPKSCGEFIRNIPE